MKSKYTLTVANSQINIVTEMSKEEIDSILGIVDRRIREIHLHSKNCSRTDAALLLCLDYCAEKIELQKTIKLYDAQLERLTLLNEAQEKEIASLTREIESLRASLNLASPVSVKAVHKKTALNEQIGIDEINAEEMPSIKEEKPVASAVDKILSEGETASERLTTPSEDKPHAKARKKKVRAMFDMISFDDI